MTMAYRRHRHAGLAHAAAIDPPLHATLRVCLLFWLGLTNACWAEPLLQVGVLSYRPLEQTRKQWSPTIEYLQKALPGYRLELLPMYYRDLDKAVRGGRLAFILTNPEHYVLLRTRIQLSAVATLMPLAEGHPVNAFGGVIISQSKQQSINTLADIRGRTIAATESGSFGGYLMQRWLLKKNDIDIADGDAKMLFTGMPQDKVVDAVLAGQADVGFVRTGVIEAMQREGRLAKEQIKVINQHTDRLFPQIHSTDLYPEWPFVVAQDVPEAATKQVVQALLNITQDSEMAKTGNYFGFSPPGDYTTVEALMLRLRAHPDRLKYLDTRDVLEKYSPWIALFVILLSGFMALLLRRRMADKRRIRAADRDRSHLLSNLGEGVYGVDSQGLCTFVNKAALEMLGFSEHEVLGHHQHEVFHHHYPDGRDYPKEACPIGQTVQDGQFRSGEEWFIRKDGSGFPVQITISKVSDGQTKGGVVVTFADISERKNSLADLAEKERFLRMVTDNLPAMIGYWTRDLHCAFANKAYQEWFGLAPEAIIGRHVRAVLGEDLYRQSEHLMRAALAGEAQNFERKLVKADGSVGYLWANYIPDKVGDNVPGFYVLASDVSELKRAEIALEEANKALLIRTNEAESANKAKSQFLANMSHEIRTPLNGVLGMAGLLAETTLDEEQRDYLETVILSGNALHTVINDILDFSKIEAGYLHVESQAFNLKRCVSDAIKLFRAKAMEKGLELSGEFTDDCPEWVAGDGMRLTQVLSNLIGNAIKFTQHGSVRMWVSVIEYPSASDVTLSIRVTDTGIGIPPDVRERLFKSFSQADATTTRRFGGTGLGLAISKKLTELMGGAISLESEAGQGSTFTVQLTLPYLNEAPFEQ